MLELEIGTLWNSFWLEKVFSRPFKRYIRSSASAHSSLIGQIVYPWK